ncbi:hypothetical protein C8Q79DRAFT_939463 [Trametes meyenii]|nr:hypothetical protein C8Q79DRAFT_939463 [Trametes meyenii]
MSVPTEGDPNEPSTPSDLESDSTDSMPDASEIIPLSQARSSTQRSAAESGSAPKEEQDDELPQHLQPERSQPPTSSRTLKSSAANSPTVASSSTPVGSAASTPRSSQKEAQPSLVPKKRARDSDKDSSELPRMSASQPLPTSSSKRARRIQPSPPATQPLPSTPAAKPGNHSSKHALTSAAKGKGKQKVISRKRNENFWHLDGSVVVQVQNTLFRLHRSRLTQHSEYFATLFRKSDRSNDGPSDMVDSCPVYVVKGVSVLDFERLLTALDAGIAYAITPPDFHVLLSLVRAAHTFAFPSILAFAVHHLRAMWPRDLEHLPGPSAQRAARATETIRLAQACGLPDLLKAAYYELLRAPDFAQDAAAYVLAESSPPEPSSHAHTHTALLEAHLRMETEADEAAAPSARLAASDLVRLVAAKQALDREWLALARAPPLPSAIPCPLDGPAHAVPAPHGDVGVGVGANGQPNVDVDGERRRCQAARAADVREWTVRLLQNGVFDAGLEDIMAGVQRLVDVDWRGMGYCIGCVGERRDAWQEAREKIWARLDVLLGLREDEAE